MNEQWRSVVGYEGRYVVSNMGRVRSLKGGRRSGGFIAASIRDGYPQVCLYRKGRKITRDVHRLVLEAFRGPCNGLLSRHLDGRRNHNELGNLAWGTQAENAADSVKHGTFQRGVRCGAAKLNDEAVKVIRFMRGRISQRQLAKVYKVSQFAIGRIQRKQNWKHVAP